MRKFLFLSWFYKDLKFTNLISDFLIKGVPSQELLSLWGKHQVEIERLLLDLKGRDVLALTYLDDGYPSFFKNLDHPPWILCLKGAVELLHSKSKVAIVGSRRPDPEALYWVDQSIKEIDKDVTLISGGAIGIDQSVHRAAHINEYRSICVLPVGIMEIYPPSLKPLLKAMLLSGNFLLVSQFHPFKKVSKSSFYPRNYIISAFADKVVVVQASLKSGTMVTAKYAIDMGREVYTLPASPWDERYGGNLQMVSDGAHQIMDLKLIHL